MAADGRTQICVLCVNLRMVFEVRQELLVSRGITLDDPVPVTRQRGDRCRQRGFLDQNVVRVVG